MDNEQELDTRLQGFAATVIRAKANLCDAQHELQLAQTKVEAAQREVAMAEHRLIGANAFLLTQEALSAQKQPDPPKE